MHFDMLVAHNNAHAHNNAFDMRIAPTHQESFDTHNTRDTLVALAFLHANANRWQGTFLHNHILSSTDPTLQQENVRSPTAFGHGHPYK